MLIHHFSVPFEDILTSKHNDARRWIGTIKLGKTECYHPHGLVVAKMLSHLTSVHAYQVTVREAIYMQGGFKEIPLRTNGYTVEPVYDSHLRA